MADIDRIMEVLQLYEADAEETRDLEPIAHDVLVDATNEFLFHHGPRFGISSWADMTQGLRDSGVDAVWHYSADGAKQELGVQVKSAGDFRRDKSFRKSVMSQIAESRKYTLSHLMLCLCADITSPSNREKARGVLAEVTQMTDKYVYPVTPEKMVGIWRWKSGLNVGPIEQMREAGYAWLTAVYDSKGNINNNSWGKGTGGDWSAPVSCTVYSGDTVTLKAIGQSQNGNPLCYRFSVQPSGRSFVVRQPWSSMDTWTWEIQLSDIGRGVVVMAAVRIEKDYYQFDDCDDYTYAVYDILPPRSEK